MLYRRVLISVFVAVVITAVPPASLFLFGLPVPAVSQSKFDVPAQSMQQDDIWTQTFYFPDRPVNAVVLRPGTYARRSPGIITVWIGPEKEFVSGNNQASGQEFIIDISALHDSRPQVFNFPAVEYKAGTRGILALVGTDIPSDGIFTLWQYSRNMFPDSTFAINGQDQQGDIFFNILTPVRGLDIFRMIKSRWQPGIQIRSLWPILSLALWMAALSVGLFFLLSDRWRSVS